MDRRIIAGDDVFSNCFSSAFKSNLKAYLLDLAFPNRCPFCGEFIACAAKSAFMRLCGLMKIYAQAAGNRSSKVAYAEM